ncbi:MAG: exopolysaccharide biosynthesis protein [Pirellulaceae bacterium]|nr:MAG: exopolysaccharide biosynthesis protein [Pirellulaceae bacterium]
MISNVERGITRSLPQDATPSWGVRDVLRLLFRHKRKSAGVMGLVLLLTFVGLMVAPRTYVSEAKLFIRIGRESVSLDPAAAVGTTVSLQDSRETEIRSVIDVLQSRVLLEKVVQRLGAATILGHDQSSSPGASDSGGRHFFNPRQLAKTVLGWFIRLDTVSPEEQAVRVLQRTIWAEAAKKSSVVSVWCKAGSPHLAQRILQTLVELYRDQHVAVNATESRAFFEKQADQLRAELLKATQELGELKSRLGITSVADQRQLLESQLTALAKDIHDTAAALSAAERRLAALRSSSSDEGQDDSDGLIATSQTAVDQMRDTLYRLQIQEGELQAKYQPEHPALMAVREQVRDVEAILRRQAIKMERAQIETLRARLESLEKSRNQAQAELLELNQNEVIVAQLERRVELLRNTYQKYSELAEQARVAQALDQERVTNVKVVQPASFVSKAASPKLSIVLSLGVIAALFGGLTVAVVAELLDSTFQTAEQVERALYLPVLVSIPKFRPEYLQPVDAKLQRT